MIPHSMDSHVSCGNENNLNPILLPGMRCKVHGKQIWQQVRRDQRQSLYHLGELRFCRLYELSHDKGGWSVSDHVRVGLHSCL